ncbi:ROK family protein [Dactylosporangium fulvum]|uniref:ROK family protein n=1 Tax=Dactylosporangium fulvum TaxID=53359 RepID=A0ABY5W895_9ACTN|nr:ROK family protein [Dactylosporangium fulvum]UWP85580.1 ROK family protein [Dactylosporangium fulvum]
MSTGDTNVVSVLDIGGTHVTAAGVDVSTRSILSGRWFREPLDGDGSAEKILSAIVNCAARLPAQPAGPWAIAVPGPFDYELGIARYAGVGKFDALNGVDLRTALMPHLPGAESVSFHNDADAFGIGEWWAGAANGHCSAVGITLGTGVGSSFLRDGHTLQDGPGIPPEGRVDLLHHDGRPLEETVSRRAIRQAYAQATGQSPAPDVREITQRARQGDRTATEVLTRTFHALGTVLGPHLAEFAPEVLVVGGSIAAAWDLLASPLRSGLTDADPRTALIALEPALHLMEAPLLGAAYLDRIHEL